MTDTTIKVIPMNGYVGNPNNKEFISDSINSIDGRYCVFLDNFIEAGDLHIDDNIAVNQEEKWRIALKAELENPEMFEKDSELSIILNRIVEEGNFSTLLQYYNMINSLHSESFDYRLRYIEAVKLNRISDIRKAFYSKYMHVFHLNHMPGHIVVGQMNLLFKGLSEFAFTKTFKIKQIPIILGGFRQTSNFIRMNVNRALFQNVFSSDRVPGFGVQVLNEEGMKKATYYLTPALKAELTEIVNSLVNYSDDGSLHFAYLRLNQMVQGMDTLWKYDSISEKHKHFRETVKRVLSLYSPGEVTVDEQTTPIEEAIVAEPQPIEVSSDYDIAF